MKHRTGSFQEFKDHTLAVARGQRRVRSDEPRIWRETITKALSDYSLGDLEEAVQRIEETETWVKQKSAQLPGPGWEHVQERLRDDRAAVEAEIERRMP